MFDYDRVERWQPESGADAEGRDLWRSVADIRVARRADPKAALSHRYRGAKCAGDRWCRNLRTHWAPARRVVGRRCRERDDRATHGETGSQDSSGDM